MTNDETEERLIVSHLTLRRVVGILGVALPVILALWGFALCECIELQDSISDYYSLRTRDALVGILFAIGWFLFAYRGYNVWDSIVGYLACLFALGVALFPNSSGDEWQRIVHFTSAVMLFLVLSIFSLFLFTKSNEPPEDRSDQKIIRNRIYVFCGAVMLACLVLIGLYYGLLEDTAISDIKPVFWLESLMLWTFGISWFVKGRTLWQDVRA